MDSDKRIKILIGIDDTDNADSLGTGYHARQLAHMLETNSLGQVQGITRHQLFVDPAIPYTSQNSSACIQWTSINIESIIEACADYLTENSAPGSDAGLCVCPDESVGAAIVDWGRSAKDSILEMHDALALAGSEGIFLRGYTGTHIGVIGALAAEGLHAWGNDGRYVWRKGIKELREINTGIFTAQQLAFELELDEISSLEGEHPGKNELILTNDWVRPVRKNHKAVLITQRIADNDEYEWELTGKEIIRTIS
jgi:hypothetical protein